MIGIGNFLFGPFAGFGFMRMALAACIALALASLRSYPALEV